MLAHAIFTPGYDGWMEQVDHAIAELKPDSMKGYTIGDNTNKDLPNTRGGWTMRSWSIPPTRSSSRPGLKNVCVHKGLFPPSVEKQFPHLLAYSDVRDVGKAAKDWPQLNFIIYHGGYRFAGGGTLEEAWAQLERTGRIEWVTDLAEIPAKYGVSNVYADLGQLFAQSTIAEPRLAAAMMGSLSRGWASTTSAGAPTRSGPARRNGRSRRCVASKFPRTCRRSTASAAGPGRRADQDRDLRRQQCPALRLHPAAARRARRPDRFAEIKDGYEQNGPARSNLRYGYVYKPA